MKASAHAIGTVATVAATLPVHVPLILGSAAAMLILLVYLGIALPAVWSAKSDRRKAAATVLHMLLNAATRRER